MENNHTLDQTTVGELKGLLSSMGEQYKAVAADLAKQGSVTSETKEKLAKIDGAIEEIQKKYVEDAQKRFDKIEEMLMRGKAAAAETKSLGDQVIEDKSFVEALKNAANVPASIKVQWPKMQVKDITGYGLLVPQTIPGIQALPTLTYGTRQLVPQGNTTSGAVEYFRELSETNNAAPVAENAPKPKSEITYEVKTAPVETIAHFFKVTRQCYDDLPGLAAQINNRGIYMLKVKEDNQLLNGTGTRPQLQGFVPIATAAPTAPAGSNLVDAIGLSVFDLAAKGFAADGTVVNPAAWGEVAMLKNQFGQYVYANPLDFSINSRIWGVRVVMSANMTASDYLVGAFQGNSQILDRMDVNVQVATQNVDDFENNRLTVLIEERLVNLIYNVNAFQKGDLPTTP